ncbi:transcriptional regulator [Rummeliibacillus sp. JY-2-4R]
MIKLGVITAQHSINSIKKIEPLLEGQCSITYIPYKKIDEITLLYKNNHLFFDGILFSGSMGYTIAKQDLKEFETPTYFLDITEGDFYKQLFVISNSNKTIKFSRVCMDLFNTENNYQSLYEVLPEDEFPQLIELTFNNDLYEDAFSKYLCLWKEKRIDLVVTRISNIVNLLKDAGIPTVFIFPSTESLLEQVKNIANELQITNLLDQQDAIGVVSIDKNNDELNNIKLHKALLEYNDLHHELSAIVKKDDNFQVITSQADLKMLTNDYQSCGLLEYLTDVLSLQVHIGWGIGTTFYQASSNAYTAHAQAVSTNSSCSYVITNNDEIIGPLGEDTCLQFTNKIDTQLQNLSESIGISTMQIQKILALLQKLQTDEITAEDLAYQLGVSVRQANRILKKMEDKKVAMVTFKKSEKLRGRPKKQYKIDFSNVGN